MKRTAYLAIRELKTPMGKKFKGHVIEVGCAVFHEKIPADFNAAKGKVRDFIDPERLSQVWDQIEPDETGLIELDLRLYPLRDNGDGPDYHTVYMVADRVFCDKLPAPFDTEFGRAIYLSQSKEKPATA